MESILAILEAVLRILMVPQLEIQDRDGYLEYGWMAPLQIPAIVTSLLVVFGYLCRSGARIKWHLRMIPLAYVLATAMTNTIGVIGSIEGPRIDLPIRQRLAEYIPLNPAPTKAKIMADLGMPFRSALVSPTNTNLPKTVLYNLRLSKSVSEVLVYQEQALDGRPFTYYIFIDPETGLRRTHVEVVGRLGDGYWPTQELR